MQWLALVPLIIKLIEIAEKINEDKPQSGEEKKSMVMSSLEMIINALAGVSTGGQKDTWVKISGMWTVLEGLFGNIIDLLVKMRFPK